jgi:hypothetical protein
MPFVWPPVAIFHFVESWRCTLIRHTERIADSYRLFLSLLYGEKPVVTGAFTIESFALMRDHYEARTSI